MTLRQVSKRRSEQDEATGSSEARDRSQFTDSHTKRIDVEGALMTTSFHAEGGDARRWLAVDARGTNFEEVRQRWAASFAADGHDLYPWVGGGGAA